VMPKKFAKRRLAAPDDFFTNAAEILVRPEVRQRYTCGDDIINARAVTPALPTTHSEAAPPVLLRGPFKGDSDLVGVAFYIGIGFIEVRSLSTTQYTYETSAIGGDGIKEREAFLKAALDLFFHDVKFQPVTKA